MISPAATPDSGNAFYAVAERARSAKAPALISCEIAGFTLALSILAIWPDHYGAAFPFGALGAFGLWGTIDHLLQSPPRLKSWRRSLLRTFQVLVAIGGVACASAAVFIAAGWLMGTFVL